MNHHWHHFIEQSNFWDITINDVATAFIAIINIILIIYIFFYQRKKDNEDHNFILSHIDFTLKSEWFKSVILEPNISGLHEFYIKLFNLFSNPIPKLDDEKRAQIINKLNTGCNKIEFRFISLLGCVDQNLENKCIDIIDKLRDDISNKVIQTNDIVPEEFQAFITSSKRDLISNLYNFIPKNLK